jgi:hypothetical protein
MAVIIYALCALTALACAVMLLLGARRTGSRMLFWSGLCFAGLSLTNGLVVVEAMDVLTRQSLLTPRGVVSLVAISLLLYGLVFEEK